MNVTPIKLTLIQGMCISFDLLFCFSTAGYISARLTSSCVTMTQYTANHMQFTVYLRQIGEVNLPGGSDSVSFNHVGLLWKDSNSIHVKKCSSHFCVN